MAFMHQMLLVLETFYAILTLPLSLQKREVRVLTSVSFSFPPPSRCLCCLVIATPTQPLLPPFPQKERGPNPFQEILSAGTFVPFPSIFCRILKYLRFYNLAFCSPNQNVCINPICSHCMRHHVHHV